MRKVKKARAHTHTHTHKNTQMCRVNKGICSIPHPPQTIFLLIQLLCLDCPIGKTACQGVHPLVWSVFAQMPAALWQDISVTPWPPPFIPPFCPWLPRITLLSLVNLKPFHSLYNSSFRCPRTYCKHLPLMPVQPWAHSSCPGKANKVGVRAKAGLTESLQSENKQPQRHQSRINIETPAASMTDMHEWQRKVERQREKGERDTARWKD